jgi:hypothetical protein
MPRPRPLPMLAALGWAACAAGCQLPDAHPQAAQNHPAYPPPGYWQSAPGTSGLPGGQGYPQPSPYGAPAPGTVPTSSPPPVPPQPVVQPAAPAANRPLLGPLLGPLMWQAEVRALVSELESQLTPEQQALVAGIPMVFDPDPNNVNAFAGCDDSGAPFVAGTEGLLETLDAIAQTRATDELFGTRTYDAYTAAVTPQLASSPTASPALPPNVIPLQFVVDARRVSRAHEMFDEIAAFTFGHELAHHYRGHTGCAHGQPSHVAPAVSDLRRIASSVIPLINQLNENEADQWGCFDVLATGRARQATGLRWTEEGGLWLFDFFSRLDGAAGASPLVGFLRTHPSPALRIPLVQLDATTWRFQHPG